MLDEADEMLDLGFREDLEFILGEMPENRRTLLFSATVPKTITKLAAQYQRQYSMAGDQFLIDGFDPWQEDGWYGKRLAFGDAILEVMEPIRRCNATMSNPDTGEKDANTLAALRDGFGHQNCGVYAVVLKSGLVQQGDQIEVL